MVTLKKENIYTHNNSNTRKFGLDLIRATAITLVLTSHLMKKVEHLGFWGVELFFGLSGFLIGHILWKSFSQVGTWSIRNIVNFWARRWWRTLPNYYLFFVVFLIYYYFRRGSLPSLDRLSNFIWFGQDLIKPDSGFYAVSWSLCVEEWFYFLFPIILLLFRKIGFKTKVSFTLSIVVVFLFCILTRLWLIQTGVGENLRVITVARLDAIASGVLVAFLSSIFHINLKSKLLLLVFGLLLVLVPIGISFFLKMPYNKIMGNTYFLLLTPLGSSLLLPYFSSINNPYGALKYFSRSIEHISLWSYSIYLSHIPILFATYYVMNHFRDNIYGNIISKMIGLLLTIYCSSFLFNFFEDPITKRRPRELISSVLKHTNE